jgi:Flp pilus assembly protein protease CpaA
MIALAAVIGLLAGWASHRAGEALARRAGRCGAAPGDRPGRGPALLRLAAALLSGRAARPDWRALAPLAAIEAAGMACFAAWSLRPGLTWSALIPAAWFCFFALVASTDLLCRWVPNAVVYPAAALAVAVHLAESDLPILAVALGGGLALAVFALAAWLRPGGLGGGDVKLAAVIGLVFGFPGVLWALLVGGALGAAVAAALLVSRNGGAQRACLTRLFCALGRRWRWSTARFLPG